MFIFVHISYFPIKHINKNKQNIVLYFSPESLALSEIPFQLSLISKPSYQQTGFRDLIESIKLARINPSLRSKLPTDPNLLKISGQITFQSFTEKNEKFDTLHQLEEPRHN